MKAALTDKFIQAIKPSTKGRLEIADMRCPGLEFRVTSGGARSWSYRFRDPASGRPARATIGPYPEIPLSRARARAEALRREVAEGTNPVRVKRQARAEADNKTFQALAARYMTEHAHRHKKPRSAAEDERNLRKHVLPKWGDRPYDSITRRDVIELLENIVAADKPVAANRVHAVISIVFSYAIDNDLVGANPASRLRKRGIETRRTRVLSDDEIRLFWERCVLPPVSRVVGLALRLALLTGLRASEVAGLSRVEIENLDDLERAALVLPGERTKNGRTHLVPLSAFAVETIKEALTLSRGEYVFGVEGHALAVALRRLKDRLPDAPGAKFWRNDPFTAHDLRRSAATRMASLGVPAEDVAAALNHVRADVTGKHYDQYARAREKRIALNTWAAALAHILDPAQAGEVVPIRGRGR